MSEKKELNNEDLKKVAGGGKDGRDGVSGPIEQASNPNSTENDTFYGPAQ